MDGALEPAAAAASPGGVNTDMDAVSPTSPCGSIDLIHTLNQNITTVHGVKTPDGKDKDEEVQRKGRRRRKKRGSPRPSLRVFKGTCIHSTEDRCVEIIRNHILGVRHGKILFLEADSNLDARLREHQAEEWKEECTHRIPEHGFMIPGFVDVHAHVFPYVLLGAPGPGDQDVEADRRLHAKRSLIHNDKAAKSVVKAVILRMLRNGTTTAAFYGTAVESATIMLAKMLKHCKMRSFVGMDSYCGANREDRHMLHTIKANDTFNAICRIQTKRVQPYIICKQPLPAIYQERVAQCRNENGVFFQTTLGDIVLDEFRSHFPDAGGSYMDYLSKYGLLDNKTLLTGCQHLSPDEMSTLAARQATVVHCPNRDAREPLSICNVSMLQQKGVNVVLGSDISCGGSVSMLDTIRSTKELCSKQKLLVSQKQSVEGRYMSTISKLCERLVHFPNGDKDLLEAQSRHEGASDAEYSITMGEAFRMATLGGAKALGLSDKVGNFAVGKEFDAIMVDPAVEASPFDIFPPHDSLEDIFWKFLILGDDRNMSEVYIGGERIK